MAQILNEIEKIAIAFDAKNSVYNNPNEDLIFTQQISLLTNSFELISDKLKISFWESVFFSNLFIHKIHNNHKVGLNSIADLYSWSEFDILKKFNSLTSLVDKGLIKSEGHRDSTFCKYSIPKRIFENILKSDNIDLIIKNKPKNFITVLDEIYSFLEKRNYDSMSCEDVLTNISEIREEAKGIPEISWLNSYKLSNEEFSIMSYIIYQVIKEDDVSVDMSSILNVVYDNIENIYKTKRAFVSGINVMFRKNLLEFKESLVFGGSRIGLTEFSSKKLLRDFDVINLEKEFKPRHSILIKADSLKNKKLFFENDIEKDFKQIKELLNMRNYKKFLERMEDSKMKKGLTILFHGMPGTGKTESVYQIAKSSGRDIMMVDISNIRDKYVGGSERRLKMIFDEYRKVIKLNRKHPILLINEADAILAKRISVSNSVDQMNNSMQNILLQELEVFEGVLIATTNLRNNIDKAFDRRFLIKTQFNNPSKLVQKKIIFNKLKRLEKKQLEYITDAFNFTGGQIDNLFKRIELNYVLGEKISNDLLISLCKCESDTSSRKEIGF